MIGQLTPSNGHYPAQSLPCFSLHIAVIPNGSVMKNEDEMKNLRFAALAVVTALALAACGDAPPADVPPPVDTTTTAPADVPPPAQ
jgi:predicted small lipoprotein YifL